MYDSDQNLSGVLPSDHRVGRRHPPPSQPMLIFLTLGGHCGAACLDATPRDQQVLAASSRPAPAGVGRTRTTRRFAAGDVVTSIPVTAMMWCTRDEIEYGHTTTWGRGGNDSRTNVVCTEWCSSSSWHYILWLCHDQANNRRHSTAFWLGIMALFFPSCQLTDRLKDNAAYVRVL